MIESGESNGVARFFRMAAMIFATSMGVSTALATEVCGPIVLRSHQHEAVQYGYAPEYIVNTPSFDSQNRPYIRSRTSSLDDTGFVQVLEDGRWISRPFLPAVKKQFPDFVRFEKGGGWLSSRIVFDDADGVYTCVQIVACSEQRIDVLIYSGDYGKHFDAYKLPSQAKGEHRAILEHRNGQGLQRPPLIMLSEEIGEPAPGMPPENRLSVVRPIRRGGRLVIPEPVVVTDRCLGLSVHSGGSPFVVTIGDKSHVVWAEVADSPDAPGTPTFVATYNAATQSMSPKVLLGYGYPKNNVHCMPSICADSEGYLHVVLGAHGKPFWYTRSLAPNDVSGGWTTPEEVLTSGFGGQPGDEDGEGRQTYAALVCDAQDSLHLVFRQGLHSEHSPHFPGEAWNALAYQRRRAGRNWEPSRWLVVPPASGYAIFYHSLAIDRRGRLYLVYSYRGGEPLRLYYGEMPGYYHYPAMLTSGDGGTGWELTETPHFERGLLGRTAVRGEGGTQARPREPHLVLRPPAKARPAGPCPAPR